MVEPSAISAPISSDMPSAFVKVAERMSVSAAADELGVGKSLVSKRIAQLEDKVHATLFSRSTRKIVLTPAGEAYLEFARRALSEMSAGEERLRSLRAELTGRIRLTAPVSWGQRVLAKRLPEFLRLHPGVEIELQLADQLMDVALRRIDVALRWTAAPPADLTAVPVARVGWVMAAAPAYLAAQGFPQTPDDLSQHSCLSYWRDPADRAWCLQDEAGTAHQVQVHSRYHVDNPDAVADAAIAGLGVALLPDYLCSDALAGGRLVPVLTQWTPRTRFGTHITAVGAPERMSMMRNRLLVDFLRSAETLQ